ncbi:hypothetical protein BKA70DRAFT_489496 [Coprinopsis sp. MPI-PUGE-AT-0042]|nr:hypothetical protein BKA70DRAFT_489496 [Coprinopsis sp. MPI-PUGE-AT-0042]
MERMAMYVDPPPAATPCESISHMSLLELTSTTHRSTAHSTSGTLLRLSSIGHGPCPPGKERVPQADIDTITPGFGAPITNTRDDLVVAKHPSRHTVYQSEALAELNCKCEPRFDQDGRKIFQTHRLTGINIYEDFRNLWPEETPWTGWDEDTSWEEEDDEWEPVEWGAWAETWGGEFDTGLSALLFPRLLRPVPPTLRPLVPTNCSPFRRSWTKLDESFGTLSQTNTPDWVGVVHEPSLVPRRDSFDTLMRDLTASLPDF